MKNNIESLINDFTCDDVIKCQTARRNLVDMGSDAVNVLVKELSNKKHWVRWEAAKALGQIGDKNAVKALVDALEDNEFDVRWLAAEALVSIGKDSLEPLLAALVDHGGESLILRQGAHHILHDMDRGDLDEIVQPVMAAVEDTAPSIEVPLVAKRALDTLRIR
ncbi:MAG: HEAT repeat domain-containing protein [Dehalococcoidia bacterium]